MLDIILPIIQKWPGQNGKLAARG